MAFRNSYYITRWIAKSNTCHTLKSNIVSWKYFYTQKSSELKIAQQWKLKLHSFNFVYVCVVLGWVSPDSPIAFPIKGICSVLLIHWWSSQEFPVGKIFMWYHLELKSVSLLIPNFVQCLKIYQETTTTGWLWLTE